RPQPLYCSLQCRRAPPAPPSFPTRRSSDLVYSVEGAAPTEPRADFSYMDSEAQNLYVGGRDGTIVVYGRNADSGALERVQTVTRSEEHTSELQSRFDLVCRLLLEKKK